MASILEQPRTQKSGTIFPDRAAFSRILAAVGLILFSVVVLIVIARRLTGAFSQEVSPAGIFCCLFGAGVFCCGLKLIAESVHRLDRRSSLIFGILTVVPLDLLAVTLLPANCPSTWLVVVLVWSSSVGCLCLSSQGIDWFLSGWRQAQEGLQSFLIPADNFQAADASARQTDPAQALPISPRGQVGEPAIGSRDAGQLISELQRRTTSTGMEFLEGQLMGRFAPGARQAVLHIPFIPPFPATPQFECEISDGAEVRLKVAAVFPYGARLELKRSASELDEQQVLLEIYAEIAAAV